MSRALSILILLMWSGQSALSQGWSQPSGEGFFKIGFSQIISDSYYAPDGSQVPITTTGISSLYLYGEYGFTNRLTGIVYAPVWVGNTLNELRFRQSGNRIPGDSYGSIGDMDLGIKVGLIQNKPVVWSGTLMLGIPTGQTGKGMSGILQTGDSEFNQLLRTDVSFSTPFSVFFSAYVGLNNRTRDFSDEFRYGFDLGYFKHPFLAAAHLQGIQSFQNGNAENVSNGIFSNNLEMLLPTFELGYFFTKAMGITVFINKPFKGQNILNAPGYGISLAYQLKKNSLSP